MTKAELIDSIASKTDLPKGTAERIVATIFDDIVAALKSGDKVHISGSARFRFRIARRAPVAIPKTGEAIQISASRSAKFKPGKTLKDSSELSATSASVHG